MNQRRGPIALPACLLLTGIVLAAPAAAQIYKWTDEKGTVHFSNDRPPQVAAELIPEEERQPLVKDAPTPPGEAEAESRGGDVRHRVAAEPAPEEVEAEETMVEDEPDVIMLDDGRPDLVTRYRANSPRNRPGQPVRRPRRRR